MVNKEEGKKGRVGEGKEGNKSNRRGDNYKEG